MHQCCGTATDAGHAMNCPRRVHVRVEPKPRQCCGSLPGRKHNPDCALSPEVPYRKAKPPKRECCDSFVGHAHARTCVVRWGDGL